jgi:hypothetical protein
MVDKNRHATKGNKQVWVVCLGVVSFFSSSLSLPLISRITKRLFFFFGGRLRCAVDTTGTIGRILDGEEEGKTNHQSSPGI